MRIIILIEEPIIPDKIAKIKYNIPISLWLVEYNHLFISIMSDKSNKL